MSALNLHKLNQKWLSVMRQARSEELRVDCTKLKQTFERVVDYKDKAINLLVSELSDSREQRSSTYLDRLLEIQKSLLEALDAHWSSSLKALSTEYSIERERLVKLHQQEAEYLKGENLALEQIYAEIYTDVGLNYQIAHDEIKNRHAPESIVEESQQSNLKELQKYTKAIEKQQKKAFDLDCAVQKVKQKQSDMQKLRDNIRAMRSRLRSGRTENNTFARDLQAECEKITLKIQQLRAKLRSDRAAERTRLVNHTMYCNNALRKLQDIVGKGEMLLRQADVCRKLETELPFYTSSLKPEELSQEEPRATEAMPEESARTNGDLGNFWQRHNKVRLERLCLERQKTVLEEENQQLRILLEQHLSNRVLQVARGVEKM